MNKNIKIGILIFIVILFVLITLLLIFNNHDKKEESINNDKNSEINKDFKNENKEGESMKNQKIKLYINNHELIATLNDNSSTKALIEELKKGSITINMKDYANMEKVGNLGFDLPRNDENITTSAGDLILYQGNNFVIYYDTNNWSLTKLGKIDNINSQELKNILGDGDVTVKLSLN